MIKKLLLVNALMAFTIFSFAQTVDITFEVNAANIDDANGLYIAGGTEFGVPGDNAMSDADDDGIWTITITQPVNSSSYWTILNGNCPDWSCKENISGQACADPDNFNDRFVSWGTDDITIKTCFAECSTDGSCSAADTRDYAALPISWDEDQDEINFNLATFDGSSAEVVESPTDAGNMVLEVKKPATAQTWAGVVLGDAGFTEVMPFDADNNNLVVRFWSPASGMPVMLKIENSDDAAIFVETQTTTTADGDWEDLVFDFTNPGPNTKPIDYANDYDKLVIFPNFLQDAAGTDYTFYVDDIQFGDEIVKEDPLAVTFQVDMNTYSGDFTTVYFSGSVNGWCADCAPMSDDDMDGVYDITVEFDETGETDYKFQLDAWNAQESWEVGSGPECTKEFDGQFVNRVVDVQEATTLAVVCWNECGPCGAAPVDVTFQVDMNTYEDDFAGVNLNGSFNDWCGECAPMTDEDEDGVYELTLSLTPEDTVEYKFVIGNWEVQEEFTEGDECTSTIDGFTNRSYAVGTEAATMDVVCWNSCEACPSSLNELNGNAFTVSPNPSNGVFNVNFSNEVDGDIVIYNYQGKVVYQNLSNTLTQSIDLSNEPAGIYLIKVMNGNAVGFSQIVVE